MTVKVKIAGRVYEVPPPRNLDASAWDILLSELTDGHLPLAGVMRRQPNAAFFTLRAMNANFDHRLPGFLRTYAPRLPWAAAESAELVEAFRKILGWGYVPSWQDDAPRAREERLPWPLCLSTDELDALLRRHGRGEAS
ncbi:MAG: hypothetical protein V3U28_05715 [Candidatus Acidoferrales bacterium]